MRWLKRKGMFCQYQFTQNSLFWVQDFSNTTTPTWIRTKHRRSMESRFRTARFWWRLSSPIQMLMLTAAATRGVRWRRDRSGNMVTYHRSTLMAVRVMQVAWTETCEAKQKIWLEVQQLKLWMDWLFKRQNIQSFHSLPLNYGASTTQR